MTPEGFVAINMTVADREVGRDHKV